MEVKLLVHERKQDKKFTKDREQCLENGLIIEKRSKDFMLILNETID